MWYNNFTDETLAYVYKKVKYFMSYTSLHAYTYYMILGMYVFTILAILIALIVFGDFSISEYFIVGPVIITVMSLIGASLAFIAYSMYQARSQTVYYVNEDTYKFTSKYHGRWVWFLFNATGGFITKSAPQLLPVTALIPFIGDVLYRVYYNNVSQSEYHTGNVLKFERHNNTINIFTYVHGHDQLQQTLNVI